AAAARGRRRSGAVPMKGKRRLLFRLRGTMRLNLSNHTFRGAGDHEQPREHVALPGNAGPVGVQRTGRFRRSAARTPGCTQTVAGGDHQGVARLGLRRWMDEGRTSESVWVGVLGAVARKS